MSRRRQYPALALLLVLLILGLSIFWLWMLFPAEVFIQEHVTSEEWDFMSQAPSYLHPEEVQRHEREERAQPIPIADLNFTNCRMETCFNFNRCRDNFKVYVYPLDAAVPMSSTYEKIINLITSSPYYIQPRDLKEEGAIYLALQKLIKN